MGTKKSNPGSPYDPNKAKKFLTELFVHVEKIFVPEILTELPAALRIVHCFASFYIPYERVVRTC